MKERNSILLVIDPQNDFVDAGEGKLYVPGAGRAIVNNLSAWIRENNESLARIIITHDSHLSYHIGHGEFWKEYPREGTEITYEDVLSGEYNPSLPQTEDGEELSDKILDYFKALNDKGKTLKIWPEHCILGSWGWSLPEALIDALNIWSIKGYGLKYDLLQKGTYPYKEMYSAMSYADGTPEMGVHDFILESLLPNYDGLGKLYIAGVAKDYCVAETVKDILKFGKEIIQGKIVFLEQCMAAIDKENPSLEIFEEAKKNYGATSI